MGRPRVGVAEADHRRTVPPGKLRWTPAAWDTVKYPEKDARELRPTTTLGPVRVVTQARSRKEAS